jgi:hypothetical protein
MLRKSGMHALLELTLRTIKTGVYRAIIVVVIWAYIGASKNHAGRFVLALQMLGLSITDISALWKPQSMQEIAPIWKMGTTKTTVESGGDDGKATR